MNNIPEYDIFEHYNADFLFKVLATDKSHERSACLTGIVNMLKEHENCHPCLTKMVNMMKENRLNVMYQKAVFLFALYSCNDFLSYVLEKDGVCKESVSLFCYGMLKKHCETLLNGNQSMSDFVTNCVVDYITT